MPSLLAVTAHPDDESFLFGGALATWAARGERAGLLCLTDGQAGRTGDLVESAGLGAVRREEMGRAASVLGIPVLMQPGLMDGGLDEYGDERGAALVAGLASEFGADVLLTFGPEGASGHADHKCCWRWTMAAAGERPVYAATFPEDYLGIVRGGKPLPVTTIVDVSVIGDAKRRAFREHRTQQDHLALLDRVLTAFGTKEYYHRASPPWREGDAIERSPTRLTTGGAAGCAGRSP